MVSLAVQKLLSLIRYHLFIFVFISITLGEGSKKILLQFMSTTFHFKTLFIVTFFYTSLPFLEIVKYIMVKYIMVVKYFHGCGTGLEGPLSPKSTQNIY